MKNYSLLLLLISNIIVAQDNKQKRDQNGFIYGAGIIYQQQIYRGFDQRTIAIPVIGYQGKKLNVFGPFISYQLSKNDHWQFDMTLSPRFNGFDESDSDFFSGMEKRSDSVDAGFSFQYNAKQWNLGIKALTDILSKSDGSSLDFSISHKQQYAGFLFEPRINLTLFDQKLNDYYYGVTQLETTEFRPVYSAGSSFNQSLNLSVLKILPVGTIRLDLGHTWYGSQITNSPLVENNSAFSTRLFFIRSF